MNRRGFTIIEVIIYVGLFGILMGGVVVAAYQLLRDGDRNEIAVAVQEEGTFISRKLNWALTNATDVNVAGGTQLVITRPDMGTSSPLTVTVADGAMTLSRGTAAATRLNAETMVVSDGLFSVAAANGSTPASVTATYSVHGTPFTFKKYLRQ